MKEKISGGEMRINVKRLCGRRIEYKRYCVPEVGTPQMQTFKGTFIEWGKSFESFEQGPIEISVAIIIDDEGYTHNVPIEFLRFI